LLHIFFSAGLAQAGSTMTAVSQIGDGQIQAPTSGSWTTSSSDNPLTSSYTSPTNSPGVVTGMPSVVTSQPQAVTSQPSSPALPGYSSTYTNGTTTTTGEGPAIQNGTTAATTASPTPLRTSTVVVSGESGVTTSIATASGTLFATATGAAVSNHFAGAGVGLLVLGLGFSLL
jgi:hypothetical protein